MLKPIPIAADLPDDPVSILSSALDLFVAIGLPAATTLAGVGLLSMAILEVVRGALPVRAWFRRTYFRRIFLREFPHSRPHLENTSVRQLFVTLEERISYGDKWSFYDTELESIKVNLASIFRSSIESIHRGCKDNELDVAGLGIVYGLAPRIQDSDVEILLSGPDTNKETLIEARSRVIFLNQQYLAAVAVQIERTWTRTMHIASVAVSAILILLLAVLYHGGIQDVPVWWLLFAPVGGSVAPVAKNLVTTLKNVKQRSK